MQKDSSCIILENMMIQKLKSAVPRQTWSYKSFWGNRRSSECFACGSLIGPGWAAGPSGATRTVSLPADEDMRYGHITSCSTTRACSITFICFHGWEKWRYSQRACSGGEASARCPFCSSRLPAPGFSSEGPLLWKQPGPLPCWPGGVKQNGDAISCICQKWLLLS